MSRISLETFIAAYGKAISSDDLERAADSWEVPALVLSDPGTTVVKPKEEYGLLRRGRRPLQAWDGLPPSV